MSVKKVNWHLTGGGRKQTKKKKNIGRLYFENEWISNIKVELHSHELLNSSKWLRRSTEPTLCPIEETKISLKCQEVRGIKIITFAEEGTTTEIIFYDFSFDTSKISKKLKIAYTIERVEQYVQNSLQCFKYQKNIRVIWTRKRDVLRACNVVREKKEYLKEKCEQENSCVNCNKFPRMILGKRLKRNTYSLTTE